MSGVGRRPLDPVVQSLFGSKALQKRAALQGRVRENVEPGAHVYTDALKSYDGLGSDFVHAVIDHAVRYVQGRVHTNTLENFWSLLKRALMGTYVAVDPAHLDAYLDEQCFRFNERRGTDRSRFHRTMRQIVGKKLTYARLTGRN